MNDGKDWERAKDATLPPPPTATVIVRVKTLGNMAWQPVQVTFNPNDFINSRNWENFFRELASSSLIGQEILSIKYYYPMEKAKKDAGL